MFLELVAVIAHRLGRLEKQDRFCVHKEVVCGFFLYDALCGFKLLCVS
jgi:hypothetical protein